MAIAGITGIGHEHLIAGIDQRGEYQLQGAGGAGRDRHPAGIRTRVRRITRGDGGTQFRQSQRRGVMRATGLERRDTGLHDGRCRGEIRLADFHVDNGTSLRLHGTGARQDIHDVKWLDLRQTRGAWCHADGQQPSDQREIEDACAIDRRSGQHLKRLIRFAEMIQHDQGIVEIMPARVVIDGDDGLESRRARGAQAVLRVLEGQALRGRKTEAIKNMMIDIGRRLFGRHHVTRTDHLEPGFGIGRDGVPQQGADIVRRGGGGDGQTDAGAARLLEQTPHAGSQRDAAASQQLGVMTRLGGMQARNQCVEVAGLTVIRAVALDIMAHALLAAGHRQQFAVQTDVPVPVQTGLGECPVEGQPVPVALGVGQGPVNIKNQRL